MAEVKELNLLCMSGQGSVQAGEALAKLHAEPATADSATQA